MSPEFFCGCCGNECGETDLWCDRCASHVGKSGYLWARTYHSMHGSPCPFDIAGGTP